MKQLIYGLSTILILHFSNLAVAKVSRLDRLEAAVNSNVILLSDVGHFRRTIGLRQQLDPLFSGTPLASKGNFASDQEIVQFLIDERIISSQFDVKDARVEQEINSIQANNNISRDVLQSALKEQGFTFSDYFELIRSSISKRDLIDREIRTKVHITEDDIKNYYYNQLADQSSGLSYRIRILTVDPDNYVSINAAENTIKKAYDAVQSGEPFEEVAKRLSDDSTAPAGGDLGYLEISNMSKQIRSEIKKLKVGGVSPILGDQNSRFYILKLADIRSDQDDRYQRMRDEIRSRLNANEYSHQISLWLSRERQNAFVHLVGDPPVPAAYVR